MIQNEELRVFSGMGWVTVISDTRSKLITLIFNKAQYFNKAKQVSFSAWT